MERDIRSDKALALATAAHTGQADKAGEPYIGHVLRVADNFRYGTDLYVAALLHDVVEDTDVTLQYVRSAFGDAVADLVDAETRRNDQGETYMDYIARVKASGDDAVALKLADLADNMDPERSTGRSDSLMKRYEKAVSVLRS
jgi:(p)ppGpp synthase/HD superfamily hydrolase